MRKDLTVMRKDLTDITLVIDRSGSMWERQKDAEGGVNSFIEDQKGKPGHARLTLYQFDTEVEVLYREEVIHDVGRYRLKPRGATALLDAVGQAVTETQERLKRIAKEERPGLVVFVIVTDGYENSSREYTNAGVKKLVEKRQAKGWQFIFLGAAVGAFAQAGQMGIPFAGTAKFSGLAYGSTYLAAASNVSRMRNQMMAGVPVSNVFTDEERKKMGGIDGDS